MEPQQKQFTEEDARALFPVKNHIHTGSDTPRIQYNSLIGLPRLLLFGGDGSGGDLIQSSSTTTVDLGSAKFYVLNYNNLSITGSGKLAFSNPHANGTVILLKVKKNFLVSATNGIDVSNCGAAGGAAVSDSVAGGGGTEVDGNDGSDGQTFDIWTSHKGLGPTDPGTGGAGGAVLSVITTYPSLTFLPPVYKHLFVGAGGGSGEAQLGTTGTGTSTSGAGGRGGGCLIIEVGGIWDFTGSINAGGSTGGNGTAGATEGAAGGGGGGGGGCFLGLYNFLTADSGTITVAGGAGGDGDSTGALPGSGGGGGGSVTVGTAGTGNSTDPDGGAGGTGYSLRALNTVFS